MGSQLTEKFLQSSGDSGSEWALSQSYHQDSQSLSQPLNLSEEFLDYQDAHPSSEHSFKNSNNESLLQYIRLPEVEDEDIKCDICLEYFYFEDDLLVCCDLCNVAVHQTCYGNDIYEEFTEEKKYQLWFCRRCIRVLSSYEVLDCQSLRCIFCQELEGALVEHEGNWIHLQCLMRHREEIAFMNQRKTLFKLNLKADCFLQYCNLCQKKQRGYYKKCLQNNCDEYNHVRCMIREGILMNKSQMVNEYSDILDYQGNLVYLCSFHLQKRKLEVRKNRIFVRCKD